MNLLELKARPTLATDDKSYTIFNQFDELLKELKKKEVSQTIVTSINDKVEQLNSSTLTGNKFAKLIKINQTVILKQLEKAHKIVPKNHYRNTWMLFGFTAFGLPIGAIISLLRDNIGLLGIGLPIGMAIGYVVGSSLDRKALNEGRQLNVEIKY